jgi:hypothetical protein
MNLQLQYENLNRKEDECPVLPKCEIKDKIQNTGNNRITLVIIPHELVKCTKYSFFFKQEAKNKHKNLQMYEIQRFRSKKKHNII